MHPRLTELLAYVEQEHQALRSTLDDVPPERRAARPTPESWTVNEVISHLTIVERRLATVFAAAIAEARAAGVPDETSTEPILHRVGVDRWRDRTRRLSGTPAVDPRTDGATYSWSDYDEARRATLTILGGADGLALEQVHRPHILFGPLNLYEWIGFLGGHAARHAAQIREIDEALSARETTGAVS